MLTQEIYHYFIIINYDYQQTSKHPFEHVLLYLSLLLLQSIVTESRVVSPRSVSE